MWFSIDSNNIEKSFIEIAIQLFAQFELIVKDAVFEFCELEFYFHATQNHPDPYVHNDKMQLTNGQWYFHGSGIDITIGDGTNCGGILIRGIYNPRSDEYYSGPLNVAKELFNSIGSIGVNNIQFGLRKRDVVRELTDDFIAVTRINLPDRNGEKEFALKKYRYLTRIEPRHPFKEKETVAKAIHTSGVNIDVINSKMFGYKIIKEK